MASSKRLNHPRLRCKSPKDRVVGPLPNGQTPWLTKGELWRAPFKFPMKLNHKFWHLTFLVGPWLDVTNGQPCAGLIRQVPVWQGQFLDNWAWSENGTCWIEKVCISEVSFLFDHGRISFQSHGIWLFNFDFVCWMIFCYDTTWSHQLGSILHTLEANTVYEFIRKTRRFFWFQMIASLG